MGTGGMGALYEVIHRPTNRRRALKLMLPALVDDAELRGRFELEARVTADVESEHIVETFDAGVDEETGAPFLVMELLRGHDLRTLLQERGRLPPREVVVLLEQAALALERTHAAGIVHRDLKPDNLFVTQRDDGSPRLKILDFGIAKLVAQSAESIKTTRSMGNPCYMAPEQIRGDGDIDARADLYSLAQIAFALVVGTAYWEAEGRSRGAVYPLLIRIAEGARVPATERARGLGVVLPPAFDEWFAWATAVDPVDRADDVRALVAALARVLDVSIERSPSFDLSVSPDLPRTSGSTELTASLRAESPRRARRTPRSVAAVVTTALVALGLGVAWRFVPTGSSNDGAARSTSPPAAPASSPPSSPAPTPAAETPEPPSSAAALPTAEPSHVPASRVAPPRRSAPPAPAITPSSSHSTPPPPHASASASPATPSGAADPSDIR
jgi:serine/threonine protein kinase